MPNTMRFRNFVFDKRKKEARRERERKKKSSGRVMLIPDMNLEIDISVLSIIC